MAPPAASGDNRIVVGSPAAASRALGVLFVANRGEIAQRVATSARRLGIRPILAHQAEPSLDLLDPSAVVAAARSVGADALHPGYGFLAESAAFAAAVRDAGIAWVGPPSAAIAAMGDKAGARRLAAGLRVPVAPGYDGEAQDEATLLREGARMGPPLLVKPVGGGGGKGIRAVRDLAELPEALAGARREAATIFGDDRLVLERLIEGPRHVEVQVLFDATGRGVQLGERDCSVQRRHQKILEETPSPGITPAIRERLADAALRLAVAVGYISAGTVEFLLADDGSFFFLEMNTRLQVEHPVTELVTGRDLVADQLRIAGGATLAELGLDGPAPTPRTGSGSQGSGTVRARAFRHAIEVRLYAEDALAGFLPATGRVELLRWPAGAVAFGRPDPADAAGLRIDAGIAEGDEVGGRFDPLLAKIVAGGRDRREALDRLAAALDATAVLGLTTNLAFLRWLVRQPWLRAGEARVDTLAQAWTPDVAGGLPDEVWQAAAARLEAAIEDGSLPLARRSVGRAVARVGRDPFRGGWRSNQASVVPLESGGLERRVAVPPVAPLSAATSVLDTGGTLHLDVGGRSVPFSLLAPPEVERALRSAAHHRGAGSAELTSPMPGSVLAIHVPEGAAVQRGDPIVTLEAMKMEHIVAAPGPGRVGEIAVRQGEQVIRGQRLAVLLDAVLLDAVHLDAVHLDGLEPGSE